MLQALQTHWLTAAVCATPVVAVLLVRKYRYSRLRIEDLAYLPQPEVDKKKGHWAWIEKAAYAGVLGRSWNMVMYEQLENLGNPPVLLIDWRPMLDAPVLFIFDHTVAEQITKATKTHSTSFPKDPVMLNLSPLVGRHSLVTLDGDEWKGLRKRILPGFQPQYLLSLVGGILDKTEIFVECLEQLAKTGEEFKMDELTTNLTFDVIGLITFNLDLNAQIPGQQSPVLQIYRALSQSFAKRNNALHWLLRYFTPNEWRIRSLDKKLDVVLKDTIRKEHAKLLADQEKDARSVMALSLKGIDKLTPEILQQTSDTCRGFLFAGHDTTSILLQWMFYEISRRPASFQALKDELDAVFGPDSSPSSVIAQMRDPENSSSIASLKYTDAIIKETLRLHPPGTTARRTAKGSDTILTMPSGDKFNVHGLILSPVAYIIQRDKSVFGETASDFVPERWLGPDAADIPDGCFRPYERGPRRCTGSELANLEAKVILAVVARRFDFVKTGLGELSVDEEGLPILDDKGCYKTESVLYTTDQVTCKVVDGTKMRVRIKGQEKSEN